MLTIDPFSEEFLKKSAVWLSDARLRALIDAPLPEWDAQVQWFSRLPSMHKYKIWGVSWDGEPIGAAGLKNISDNSAEYFGYIAELEFRGKGLGRAIIRAMETKAISFGVSHLTLRVTFSNFIAINLYFSENFKISAILDEKMFFMEKVLEAPLIELRK